MQKRYLYLFFCLFISSCVSQKEILPAPYPKNEIKKAEDVFYGVYSITFPFSKSGIKVYAVEFSKDNTARVFIFKKDNNKPLIHKAKWLITNENIIVLYFEKLIPSEFFIRNSDGTISFLNEQKKTYDGELGEILILRKVSY